MGGSDGWSCDGRLPTTDAGTATVPSTHGRGYGAASTTAVPDATMSGKRSGHWSGHHLKSTECCDFPDIFCCSKIRDSHTLCLRWNHSKYRPLKAINYYEIPLLLSV